MTKNDRDNKNDNHDFEDMLYDENNEGMADNEDMLDDIPYSEELAHYYLKAYDKVIGGDRKYPANLFKKDLSLIKRVLQLIFSERLHWTHEQVRDCLTPAIVISEKLTPFIERIPCPQEILSDKGELYYIAWELYPETRNLSETQLIIKVWKDVLGGRRERFPKEFFDGNDGFKRARILLLTMINEYMSFESKEELYEFFASSKGRKALRDYRLEGPLHSRYETPLEYLHDILDDTQKDEILYAKYENRSRM